MWSFPDSSTFVGSDKEIIDHVRVVGDIIEAKVKAFIKNSIEENRL
ncbi:MAG: hypothetical protein NTY39_04720 [Campylobacterales bacterium]|nr:hypothetical protein [Campylobacterales bacterium]